MKPFRARNSALYSLLWEEEEGKEGLYVKAKPERERLSQRERGKKIFEWQIRDVSWFEHTYVGPGERNNAWNEAR